MNVQENINTNKKSNTYKALLSRPVVIRQPFAGTSKTGNPLLTPVNNNRQFKSLLTPIQNTNTFSSKTKTGSSNRSLESHVLLALSEGRGQARAVVGLAAIDANRPNLVLCQIHDSQNYINTLTKINILNPVEILMPSTIIDNSPHNRLFLAIKEHFKNITITAVPRKEYNSSGGLQYITKLSSTAYSSVILLVKHKFYALSATCCLLRYLEHTQHVLYGPQSIKIEYQEPENTTLIDVDTADNMELVRAQNGEIKNGSLFAILNHCCTKIGKRHLRATILQPPCSSTIVEARLDCVQEFLDKPAFHNNIRSILFKLMDIDHLLMFGVVLPESANLVSERQLNYILQLKSTIGLVEPLSTELTSAAHPTFRAIYQNLLKFPHKKISELISTLIQEEARAVKGQGGDFQRCFAIKSRKNELLDVLRKCHTEIIDDMRNYVEELALVHNLPLKLNYNCRRSYHITMNTAGHRNMKMNDLPELFLQIERKANSFSMTTMDLVYLDNRLEQSMQGILSMSNTLIHGLLMDLREYVSDLYKLCDEITHLDILQSLAQASSNGHNYTRPNFSEFMELENARHPLLDYLRTCEPISNPTFASEFHNFHLITGPNMAGKSIYIRQIILNQIMAQVGCFIPATKATLRLSNRIFARIGQGDNFECNASSFVLEMKEMQYIFNSLTNNSLIIIDELCRSTSVDEGASIAYAICEKLIKSKAFTFFATHFMFLANLSNNFLNVTNWQLETLEQENRLTYTHRLIPGITTIKNYGIKLAKLSAVPKFIIREAEDLLTQLKPLKKTGFNVSLPTSRNLRYKLTAELKLLEIKGCVTKNVYEQKLQEFEIQTGFQFEPLREITTEPETTEIVEKRNEEIFDQKIIDEFVNSMSAEKENENDTSDIFNSLKSNSTNTKSSIFANFSDKNHSKDCDKNYWDIPESFQDDMVLSQKTKNDSYQLNRTKFLKSKSSTDFDEKIFSKTQNFEQNMETNSETFLKNYRINRKSQIMDKSTTSPSISDVPEHSGMFNPETLKKMAKNDKIYDRQFPECSGMFHRKSSTNMDKNTSSPSTSDVPEHSRMFQERTFINFNKNDENCEFPEHTGMFRRKNSITMDKNTSSPSTSDVPEHSGMFQGRTAINLNKNNKNNEFLENSGIFHKESLTNMDKNTSSPSTSDVPEHSRMFQGRSAINLNKNHKNNEFLENSGMFHKESLTNMDKNTSSPSTSDVPEHSRMFQGRTAINLNKNDKNNEFLEQSGMFHRKNSITLDKNTSSPSTSDVPEHSGMFQGRTAINLNKNDKNNEFLEDSEMFSRKSSINMDKNTSSPSTSDVPEHSRMFQGQPATYLNKNKKISEFLEDSEMFRRKSSINMHKNISSPSTNDAPEHSGMSQGRISINFNKNNENAEFPNHYGMFHRKNSITMDKNTSSPSTSDVPEQSGKFQGQTSINLKKNDKNSEFLEDSGMFQCQHFKNMNKNDNKSDFLEHSDMFYEQTFLNIDKNDKNKKSPEHSGIFSRKNSTNLAKNDSPCTSENPDNSAMFFGKTFSNMDKNSEFLEDSEVTNGNVYINMDKNNIKSDFIKHSTIFHGQTCINMDKNNKNHGKTSLYMGKNALSDNTSEFLEDSGVSNRKTSINIDKNGKKYNNSEFLEHTEVFHSKTSINMDKNASLSDVQEHSGISNGQTLAKNTISDNNELLEHSELFSNNILSDSANDLSKNFANINLSRTNQVKTFDLKTNFMTYTNINSQTRIFEIPSSSSSSTKYEQISKKFNDSGSLITPQKIINTHKINSGPSNLSTSSTVSSLNDNKIFSGLEIRQTSTPKIKIKNNENFVKKIHSCQTPHLDITNFTQAMKLTESKPESWVNQKINSTKSGSIPQFEDTAQVNAQLVGNNEINTKNTYHEVTRNGNIPRFEASEPENSYHSVENQINTKNTYPEVSRSSGLLLVEANAEQNPEPSVFHKINSKNPYQDSTRCDSLLRFETSVKENIQQNVDNLIDTKNTYHEATISGRVPKYETNAPGNLNKSVNTQINTYNEGKISLHLEESNAKQSTDVFVFNKINRKNPYQNATKSNNLPRFEASTKENVQYGVKNIQNINDEITRSGGLTRIEANSQENSNQGGNTQMNTKNNPELIKNDSLTKFNTNTQKSIQPRIKNQMDTKSLLQDVTRSNSLPRFEANAKENMKKGVSNIKNPKNTYEVTESLPMFEINPTKNSEVIVKNQNTKTNKLIRSGSPQYENSAKISEQSFNQNGNDNKVNKPVVLPTSAKNICCENQNIDINPNQARRGSLSQSETNTIANTETFCNQLMDKQPYHEIHRNDSLSTSTTKISVQNSDINSYQEVASIGSLPQFDINESSTEMYNQLFDTKNPYQNTSESLPQNRAEKISCTNFDTFKKNSETNMETKNKFIIHKIEKVNINLNNLTEKSQESKLNVNVKDISANFKKSESNYCLKGSEFVKDFPTKKSDNKSKENDEDSMVINNENVCVANKNKVENGIENMLKNQQNTENIPENHLKSNETHENNLKTTDFYPKNANDCTNNLKILENSLNKACKALDNKDCDTSSQDMVLTPNLNDFQLDKTKITKNVPDITKNTLLNDLVKQRNDINHSSQNRIENIQKLAGTNKIKYHIPKSPNFENTNSRMESNILKINEEIEINNNESILTNVETMLPTLAKTKSPDTPFDQSRNIKSNSTNTEHNLLKTELITNSNINLESESLNFNKILPKIESIGEKIVEKDQIVSNFSPNLFTFKSETPNNNIKLSENSNTGTEINFENNSKDQILSNFPPNMFTLEPKTRPNENIESQEVTSRDANFENITQKKTITILENTSTNIDPHLSKTKTDSIIKDNIEEKTPKLSNLEIDLLNLKPRMANESENIFKSGQKQTNSSVLEDNLSRIEPSLQKTRNEVDNILEIGPKKTNLSILEPNLPKTTNAIENIFEISQKKINTSTIEVNLTSLNPNLQNSTNKNHFPANINQKASNITNIQQNLSKTQPNEEFYEVFSQSDSETKANLSSVEENVSINCISNTYSSTNINKTLKRNKPDHKTENDAETKNSQNENNEQSQDLFITSINEKNKISSSIFKPNHTNTSTLQEDNNENVIKNNENEIKDKTFDKSISNNSFLTLYRQKLFTRYRLNTEESDTNKIKNAAKEKFKTIIKTGEDKIDLKRQYVPSSSNANKRILRSPVLKFKTKTTDSLKSNQVETKQTKIKPKIDVKSSENLNKNLISTTNVVKTNLKRDLTSDFHDSKLSTFVTPDTDFKFAKTTKKLEHTTKNSIKTNEINILGNTTVFYDPKTSLINSFLPENTLYKSFSNNSKFFSCINSTENPFLTPINKSEQNTSHDKIEKNKLTLQKPIDTHKENDFNVEINSQKATNDTFCSLDLQNFYHELKNNPEKTSTPKEARFETNLFKKTLENSSTNTRKDESYNLNFLNDIKTRPTSTPILNTPKENLLDVSNLEAQDFFDDLILNPEKTSTQQNVKNDNFMTNWNVTQDMEINQHLKSNATFLSAVSSLSVSKSTLDAKTNSQTSIHFPIPFVSKKQISNTKKIFSARRDNEDNIILEKVEKKKRKLKTEPVEEIIGEYLKKKRN